MDNEEQLKMAVEALNAALGTITPYRIIVIRVADICLLDEDKNPRYMPRKEYRQLVDNIRADSNLSSLPLLWKSSEGKFVCLSGNHRVMAARDAGIEFVLALYTDKEMSRQEQVAVQLSHNSLSGLDDPAKLTEIWREISALEWKVYSGIDDGMIKTFAPVKIQRIDESKLHFEEIRLLFTQTETRHLKEVLKAIGASTKTCLVARYEDFDRFFDVLLKFKESEEVLNTATALRRMTDIVEEWLKKSEHNAFEL